MRHAKKFNHLGRTAPHRKATLQNMSVALIKHKRIITTLAKAKALRPHLEPIITKSKANNMHARRVVFQYLQDKEAVKELFGPILIAIGERPGGYLRIIRMGFRKGDGAQMAMIEFVDFNETYNPNDGNVPGKKRTRRGGRTRRSGRGSTGAAAAAAATDSGKEEE
ncbi:50S ribosomal protein L17 [Membranicola marinus]|uniref:Large ribosomal subunit protein bL17 n=1 Tax=Membranihabitans marinus TaxID=1227546 RepID=A0A953HX01_9BACT|nr:50S ribosomal protein L17 [Membranihabitans marinus]MBY5959328.1 50S ribosomal protein L17 [Membranihabitans marinus]